MIKRAWVLMLALGGGLTACGTDVVLFSSGTGGDGGGDAGIVCDESFDGPGAQPPSPPAEKEPTGKGVILAINHVDFGSASATGWTTIGFNLDGKTSTASSSDLCEPPESGDPDQVYPDGDDGIDNNFGKLIVGLLAGFDDPVFGIDSRLWAGDVTYIFAIEWLGTDDRYNPVTTRFYRGAELGAPAEFDGTDEWPIRSDSLQAPSDAESAKVTLHCSYLADDTWVSGRIDELTIELPWVIPGEQPGAWDTAPVVLPMRNAVITLDLNAAHTAAMDGTVAGTLATADFVQSMRAAYTKANPTAYCDSGFNSIADQIRRASDMRLDGEQDPATTCDGISIGFRIRASRVKLGSIQLAPAEPPDPCDE